MSLKLNQRDKDGRLDKLTDMINPTGTFQDYVNALKNETESQYHYQKQNR